MQEQDDVRGNNSAAPTAPTDPTAPTAPKPPGTAKARSLCQRMLELGVICHATGDHSNVIKVPEGDHSNVIKTPL